MVTSRVPPPTCFLTQLHSLSHTRARPRSLVRALACIVYIHAHLSLPLFSPLSRTCTRTHPPMPQPPPPPSCPLLSLPVRPRIPPPFPQEQVLPDFTQSRYSGLFCGATVFSLAFALEGVHSFHSITMPILDTLTRMGLHTHMYFERSKTRCVWWCSSGVGGRGGDG